MEVSFLCEWITPALWHGAEPKGTPEVRSASLKGLLRYWWRVIYQDCAEKSDYSSLFRRESELFGSTEGASPLIVRVEEGKTTSPFIIDPKSPLISRLSYFLFPFQKASQKALAPGNTFKVILTLRKGYTGDLEPLRQAVASFWFLAHLGSIGSRSRRGMGSFIIRKAECKDGEWKELLPNGWNDFPIVKGSSIDEYKEAFKKQFEGWRSVLPCPSGASPSSDLPSSSKASPSSSLPDFPKLNLINLISVWLWNKAYSSWDDALAEVANSLSNYRHKQSPDYIKVKSDLSGKSKILALPIKRIGFGLPIVFRFKSRRGASGTLQGETHNRRASPVWLRVVKLGEGNFTVHATFLKARILPPNEKLMLKSEERKIFSSPLTGSSPALSYVEEWFSRSDWVKVT